MQRNRLVEAAKKVEGAEAVLAAKANEQGVLFGSITSEQVAANLRQQGFEVADDVVELPHHIKQIGTHTVTLTFDHDLTAKVKVTIVPEGTIEADKGQQEQNIEEPEQKTEDSGS